MYISTRARVGMVYVIADGNRLRSSHYSVNLPNGTVIYFFSIGSFLVATPTPTNSTFWEVRLYKV